VKITVVIPTHDHLELVRFPIACVRRQTHADWELFVVGDGAHPESLRVVRAAAEEDARIRLFDFPKGERHGEAHRHAALQEATGEAVCYLGDDDLWMPDHLAVMAALLADHDFAHTRHTQVQPGPRLLWRTETLADPQVRERMLTQQWNFFGATTAGHRLDFYRRLPEGWSPAPWDSRSDLHMWRKVLRAPGARLVSSPRVTTLHLASSGRPRMLPSERYAELQAWDEQLQNPAVCEQLRAEVAGAGAPLDEGGV
jgi:glycosyltransferase involved in cell wall biosynthesis